MDEIKNPFKLRLFINGKIIPLKPFLQNFVSQIILALVNNLKDIDEPKKIELKLEKKQKGDCKCEC